MTNIKHYLTTDEVAAYLGYETAGAVREARAHGLEPIGRRGPRGPYLYRVEDVDEWLKNCLAGEQARQSAASSPAVDYDGVGENEEDERSRHLPANQRPVSSPCNGEVPDHGEDAGDSTNTTTRRHNGGGIGATRRAESIARTQSERRIKDHYRGRLRDALAGSKVKKA